MPRSAPSALLAPASATNSAGAPLAGRTLRENLGGLFLTFFATLTTPAVLAAGAPSADPSISRFREQVQPILVNYCYDCHGDGMKKGKVSFDDYRSEADLIAQAPLWLAALKNVRAGVMPPDDGPRPSPEEVHRLEQWIKHDAFGIDPANPDPGRVTLRRLNRVEYRNTIRDLMGIDFNSEVEFPPDDTGHGFDNNGDVLTLSPLHLEKYLQAAETIVTSAVPTVARVMPAQSVTHADFRTLEGKKPEAALNLANPIVVRSTIKAPQTDTYEFAIELEVRGSFDFDPGRARVTVTIDGQKRFEESVVWQPSKRLQHAFTEPWTAGPHEVLIEIEPLPHVAVDTPSPANSSGNPTRISLRVVSAELKGPLNPDHWIPSPRYDRFFTEGPAPADQTARIAYAERLLRDFTSRAFRRPVDEAKVAQLTAFARAAWEQPGACFESGIGRAFMAVLASPRFLFRVEHPASGDRGERFPRVDEFALASRLSYFLWSSMPDETLRQLAARGELRAQLPAQIGRMLADPRAEALTRNFVGQWLQARDVESVPINLRAALGITQRGPNRVEFSTALRQAMRRETELCFEHVVREDRSVLELLDSRTTFVNELLARHYGIPDVVGPEFRQIELPVDSPRGGVLTQGTLLSVTSNPTRTSPVKRGLFILENILGVPPPPAPPNVPDLEDAKKEFKHRDPTLREMLELHRQSALCSSCHSRMDPLGLALENFNVVGGWRESEGGQAIDASGQLITGEAFRDIRELKRILTTDRRIDYYRCLTEKVMIYALGRGVEAHDVHSVDQIVEQLEREGGRFSVLLNGVIASAAFQRQRATDPVLTTSIPPSPAPFSPAHSPTPPAAAPAGD